MNVLLVGHCMTDRFSLTRAVARALPEAKTDGVNSDAALAAALDNAALLLVNRVLDGRFSARDGVALIRSVTEREGARPVAMLVSNYDDAQAAAIEVGAAPGFGKAELRADRTAMRLRVAVGLDTGA
ncbi:MAG: hypothetical protein ACF8QF_07270 [Phycisphaerales bacterium]